MKHFWKTFLLAVLLCAGAFGGGLSLDRQRVLAAEVPQAAGPGFLSGETLRYKLLWPSGVGLGEGVFTATATGKNELLFELSVEADLPTRDITIAYTSRATREGLCSLLFQTKSRDGTRVSEDSTEFDQKAHQAHRFTGGQTNSATIPDCARDPLTFFYYFRSQIAAGAPVNAATFYTGPGYGLDIKPAGHDTVSAAGAQQAAERYSVTYRGPNNSKSFEMWISANSRREPLRVHMPFPLALFSAELE